MIQVKDVYPASTANPNLFGFTIDESNTNPESSVIYTDSAINYAKGSVNWDNSNIFKNIKPCLLNAGAVVGYLNKNDFTKFENGTNADIASGSSGDVMIEIPKIAWYMSKTGTVITAKLFVGDGAAAVDSRFTYLAHSRDSLGDRSKIYVGAYLGTSISSKIRSLSGYVPTNSLSNATCRSQSQSNGTGYQFMTFFAHMLVQMLFILRYGSRNSQSVLGRGFVNESGSTHANTGGTNQKGMNYGETTGKYQSRFMGIEDIWGNLYARIEGLIENTSGNIVSTYKAFNDTGSGFLYSTPSVNLDSFNTTINRTIGSTTFGFLPLATVSANYELNYCDSGRCSIASSAARSFVVGGNSDASTTAGLFGALDVDTTAQSTFYGTRLCYI